GDDPAPARIRPRAADVPLRRPRLPPDRRERPRGARTDRLSEAQSMPLLDHFRPPLTNQHRWESFFIAWPAILTGQINGPLLPEEFAAVPLVSPGGQVEVEPSLVVE